MYCYRLLSIWCAVAYNKNQAHSVLLLARAFTQVTAHKKVSPSSFPTLKELHKNESNELESDSFKWNYTYLYEFQSGKRNMDFFTVVGIVVVAHQASGNTMRQFNRTHRHEYEAEDNQQNEK